MRAIDGYPDPNASSVEHSGNVSWKGQDVEVHSLNVTRSFGTGLPSGVSGIDDFVAATGSASWAMQTTDITDGLHLPWLNPNIPHKGDQVTLDLGYSGVNARALTGVVSSPRGDVQDERVSVDLVDRIDRLNLPFSIDPIYYRQPSLIPGEELTDIGLHPCMITDLMLRRCGFYATPPRVAGGILSAPMMGSLWPEQGSLEYGRSAVDRTSPVRTTYPQFAVTSFGLGLLNGTARYRPASSAATYSNSLYFHWLTGRVTGGGAHRVRVEFSNGSSIGLWLGASSQQLTLTAYDTTGAVASTRDFTLDAATASQDNEVSVWVTTGGAVTVKVNDQTFTASGATVAHSGSAVKLIHTQVDTSQMWLAGLKVGFTAATNLHSWSRTAILEVSAQDDQQLANVPAIVDQTCLDLLKAQAKSELAAMWLDQTGRFRYRSRDRLMGAAPSWGISLDSIEGIQWTGASAAGQVTVKWRRPSTTRSNRPWVTVHESSSVTVRPGDIWETIVHPETDADWIRVAPLGVLDTAADEADFNKGIGSWVAGLLESDTTGVAATSAATYLKSYASLEKLDARSYKLRIDGTNIPSGKQLTANTADWSGLNPSRRDASTPILRAYGLVAWSDAETVGLPLGAQDAGAYEHDSSWWIQNDSFAQRIADWIAEGLTSGLPVMDGISVTPDDRRELGDVCTVDLGTIKLKCLTVAIEDSVDAGGRSQNLTLQVIGVL